jgi:RNA recognition motif-containing protein
MEYKLYVGNLSYNVAEADLQTLFAQAGAVKSVAVIKDKFTGQSKGFAFIEMETMKDMQNAITMFHGKDFQDRALTVNQARPREERGGFGGGNRGGGYGNNRGGGFGNNRGGKKPGGGRRSW